MNVLFLKKEHSDMTKILRIVCSLFQQWVNLPIRSG